jgi:hypothetical protein
VKVSGADVLVLLIVLVFLATFAYELRSGKIIGLSSASARRQQNRHMYLLTLMIQAILIIGLIGWWLSHRPLAF